MVDTTLFPDNTSQQTPLTITVSIAVLVLTGQVLTKERQNRKGNIVESIGDNYEFYHFIPKGHQTFENDTRQRTEKDNTVLLFLSKNTNQLNYMDRIGSDYGCRLAESVTH
jgi:hypothetical protein